MVVGSVLQVGSLLLYTVGNPSAATYLLLAGWLVFWQWDIRWEREKLNVTIRDRRGVDR